MLPTPPLCATASQLPHRPVATAWKWCAAASIMTAVALPGWAQTPASTEQARERSQRQSDNVYRWIKFFADQPKRRSPNTKLRAKPDEPSLAQKPEIQPPLADTAPASPVINTAETPATAAATLPVEEATQPPAAQAIAVATDPVPAEVEPTIAPLRPISIVEPTIPREMRHDPISAKVLLSFTVQPDGSVATPQVVAGNNRRLNRSAIDAIAQWRFEPIQTARLTQVEFEFRQD